jgi:hypothetical protein
MRELQKAIWTVFTATPANAFYTAVGGQFQFGGVGEQSWSDNFAAATMSISEDDSFRQAIEDVDVRIDCYSSTTSGAWAIIEAARALYDGTQLSITGYYSSKLRREFIFAPLWDDGAKLYHGWIELSTKIQKTS